MAGAGRRGGDSRRGAAHNALTGPRSWTLGIALVTLGTTVVGSALAVGAVHLGVLLAISTTTLLGCSFVLYRERSRIRRLASPALLLLGLAAWSALQAAPLPIALLLFAAPHNADVWMRSVRPFAGHAPRFATLSLDPGASLVEALKWFTYALVFVLAHLVEQGRKRQTGSWIVFGSAVAVSVTTLVHGVLGAKSLFGLYTPELAIPRWGIAPILNANNLAGYLNLGTFCGLGLFISRRHSEGGSLAAKRIAVGSGLAVLVAISVLAASRGGVLGLGVGLLFVGTPLFVSKMAEIRKAREGGRASERQDMAALGAVIAIGGGVALAIAASSHETWAELWNANVEKLRLVSWSVPLIRDFPWFGVGRGAFESAFPAYRPLGGHVVYTHAENFVVQWVAEWGSPIALVALGLLAWFYRPGRLGVWRDRARLTAFIGVAILLFQNLVDLALEIPAISIALWALVGSLWRDRFEPYNTAAERRETASPPAATRTRSLGDRALATGVFVGGVLALVLAATRGNRSVADERETLYAAFQSTQFHDAPTFDAFRERLRAAVSRHPADPYFPLLGALAAQKTKGENAMPWIAAALERDPKNGRAHLVLAEVLGSRGVTSQALMELRLAVEADSELADAVAQIIVRIARDVGELERAAPDGTLGARMLVAEARYEVGDDKRELRLELLDEAIHRDPTYADSRMHHAVELMAAIDRANRPCGVDQRARCAGFVRNDANAIREALPTSCEPVILEAQLTEREGRFEDAERLLASACGGCRDGESCSAERVRLAAAKTPSETLGPAVRAYLATACSGDMPCIGPHKYVGDVFAARAEWNAAAEHYALAASADDSADAWIRAADAAVRAGQPTAARRALAKAEQKGKSNPLLEQRIEEQRRALLDRELQPLGDHK